MHSSVPRIPPSTSRFSSTDMSDIQSTVTTPNDDEELPHKLPESLLRLLFSGEESDCTVKCGEIEWAAHRCIVYRHWGFVRTALQNFKVSDAQLHLPHIDTCLGRQVWGGLTTR